MLIVMDGLLDQFPVESHLSFHLLNQFGVHAKFLGVEAEVVIFGLMQLIEWMSTKAIDIDTLLRVRHKYLGDNILCIRRQKFGK
jgi:hypothetical protein